MTALRLLTSLKSGNTESSQRGNDVFGSQNGSVKPGRSLLKVRLSTSIFCEPGACSRQLMRPPNEIKLQGLRGYTFGPEQDRRFIIDVDSEDEDDLSSDEDEDNHREEFSEGYSTEEAEFSPDDHKEEHDGDVVVVSNGRTTEQQRWVVQFDNHVGTPNAFVDLLKKTLFRVEISSIKLLPCHS